MQLVDSKEIKYKTTYTEIDWKDKLLLHSKGMYNGSNNDSFTEKPCLDIIEHCAEILSQYYGKLTKYSLWECSVTGWRIIYGN